MFALVPLITGLLTVIAVRRQVFRGAGGDELIRGVLLAVVLWGAYLALMTEALSLFAALRFGPLLAAWVLPIPLLLWSLRQSPSVQRVRSMSTDSLATWEIGALVAVAGFVSVTGLIAFFSAPNTWDSMTYHLPRAMHWAQNGSIAHYATHEPRQLYLSPWAESVATHFQILGGGDRAARLLQWLAMAGSLLAVSAIAGQLGAGRRGRILSVLVAATIPMGLLQAVSTQTDYVVSFHLAAAVSFLFGLERRLVRGVAWPHLWGAALATGLAMLTKGTTYVVLAPFLAVFLWRVLKTQRILAWRPLLTFAAIVMAINLGHYSRNIRLFDAPLQAQGLDAYHRYGNEVHGIGVTLSNATRFAALHLSVPAPGLVARAYRAVRGLHRVLGLDPEDPRTTWPDMRFEPPPRVVHEDWSGNFLHSCLIAACIAAFAVRRVRQAFPRSARHALLIAAGCLLFAALLKWTPWSTRLHLPLFVLAAPIVGTLLAWRPELARTLGAAVAAALMLQAIPFVTHNPLHPLTGKDSIFRQPTNAQMFRGRPLLGEFYTQAAERLAPYGPGGGRTPYGLGEGHVKSCSRIGIEMPPDAWEYPLWVVVRQSAKIPVRFENLNPRNVSQRLFNPRFEPCAVVCVNCDPTSRQAYRARFGEPVLAAAGDLPGRERHLLFLESRVD